MHKKHLAKHQSQRLLKQASRKNQALPMSLNATPAHVDCPKISKRNTFSRGDPLTESLALGPRWIGIPARRSWSILVGGLKSKNQKCSSTGKWSFPRGLEKIVDESTIQNSFNGSDSRENCCCTSFCWNANPPHLFYQTKNMRSARWSPLS